jgi:predicted RNA binding protein YcfA (HicA-like mRNA interferase family)
LGGDLSDPFEDVKFSAFVQVLAAHGFSLHRQGAGSHAIYRGVVSGEVRLVVVVGALRRYRTLEDAGALACNAIEHPPLCHQ